VKIIQRLEDLIKKFEAFFLFLITSFVLVVTFLQVILRNFFHSGITWGDDISRHLVFWIAMFGASLATSDGRHINVEILPRFLSDRWKYLNRVMLEAVAVVICAFLFYYSTNFVKFEREAQEALVSLNIQIWVIALAFPIGFGVITLKFLIRFLRALLRT
jgi:TRAP-type C4-dicarboxylate transport system permease small subunit